MRGSRRWGSLAGLVVGLALLTAGPVGAEAPRASGGERLVEASEEAALTLVGVAREPERLDVHAYAVLFDVESRVSPRYPGPPTSDGEPIRVAWEELATRRAPRFQAGDRVLLCLERLPGASIWQARLPDAATRGRTFGVAMRGDAFLRDPALATIGRLQHYLALSRRAREEAPGSALLVDLVADAEVPIAVDAALRLASRGDLEAQLDDAQAATLVGALLRADADAALEDAIVSLLRNRRLMVAEAPLRAILAGPERPPASVYAALAALGDGLSVDEISGLLRDAPARYREEAARAATGPGAGDLLLRLSRSDPEPAVRAAALARLSTVEPERASEPLAGALGDPAPIVRRVAIQAFADQGDAALPTLLRVIDANDPLAAQTAVAAIASIPGDEARAALEALADGSDDDAVRTLAAIALGRPIADEH